MAPKNWTWKKLFSSNQKKTLGRLLPRIWLQPAHHLKQLSYQKSPLCLFILLFNVQKIHPLQDFQVLQVLFHFFFFLTFFLQRCFHDFPPHFSFKCFFQWWWASGSSTYWAIGRISGTQTEIGLREIRDWRFFTEPPRICCDEIWNYD